MLSADDTIHAVAYDAAVITVGQNLPLTITRSGTNILLHWTNGSAPYVVQRSTALPPNWTPLLTTNTQSVQLPATNPSSFFRLLGQ